MKVATTVFIGNISEKASDTLIRQILLVMHVLVTRSQEMVTFCVRVAFS